MFSFSPADAHGLVQLIPLTHSFEDAKHRLINDF
jgi:hypothetical protein